MSTATIEPPVGRARAPRMRGRQVAFETLVRFLVEGVRPAPSTKLAPHIVLRSNLGLFLNYVSGPDENVGTG